MGPSVYRRVTWVHCVSSLHMDLACTPVKRQPSSVIGLVWISTSLTKGGGGLRQKLTIADKGEGGLKKINKGFLRVQKMWIERTIGIDLYVNSP